MRIVCASVSRHVPVHLNICGFISLCDVLRTCLCHVYVCDYIYLTLHAMLCDVCVCERCVMMLGWGGVGCDGLGWDVIEWGGVGNLCLCVPVVLWIWPLDNFATWQLDVLAFSRPGAVLLDSSW